MVTGYDPPEFDRHFRRHQDAGERPMEIKGDGDLVTKCSICDPLIQDARAEETRRRLMARAWNEGFKAGNRNPGFESGPNPYRD